MKKRDRVGIRELKNETSRIVREVREQGEEYVVTQRGRSVAVLRPWSSDDECEATRDEARLALRELLAVASEVGAKAGRKSAVAAVERQRR